MDNNIENIWSDILTYRPYISFKNKKTKYDAPMYEEDKTNFTNTVNEFIQYSPLTVYNNMNNCLEEFDNFTKILSEYKGELYVDEVSTLLDNDKKYIYSFKDKYINLYYKCDKDKLQHEEDKNITLIKKYDREDRTKINYFSLAYDSYISSMISAYIDSVVNQNRQLVNEIIVSPGYVELQTNDVIKNNLNLSCLNDEENLKLYIDKYITDYKDDKIFKSVYRALSFKNDVSKYIKNFYKVDKTANSFYINKLFDTKDELINTLNDYCTDVFKVITLNNLNKNHCIDNIVNLHSCKNLCKYL